MQRSLLPSQWPMHRRLHELAEYVEMQRTALLETAATLSADRWGERPAPDRWSVNELIEHLAMVEHSCARVIAKAVAESRAASLGAESDESSVLAALDHARVTDRSNRMQVPDRVAPTGRLRRQQSLDALAASRAELRQALRDADGLALGTIRRQHARLGELDLYQWILFVGQHEARHRSQLGEIVAGLEAMSA
jgi:uncharacterized damage-inducible protein DinB